MCLAYRLNVVQNPSNQQVLSDGWHKYFGFRIPPAEICCDGCMADDPHLIDRSCPVRPCVIEKGLDNCSQCDGYVCAKLKERLVVYAQVRQGFGAEISEADRRRFIQPYENQARLDALRSEIELSPRRIQLPSDCDAVLEFHCRINYESDTPYARRISYPDYREKWLSTSQPETFLAHLAHSMLDDRTLAEIWQVTGCPAGYLWMTFTDLPDYGLTIAELMDIAVLAEFQGREIGTKMIQRAEQHACRMGADLFRSETGVDNLASQKLHTRAGFKPYRIGYEKVLAENPGEGAD